MLGGLTIKLKIRVFKKFFIFKIARNTFQIGKLSQLKGYRSKKLFRISLIKGIAGDCHEETKINFYKKNKDRKNSTDWCITDIYPKGD